MGRSKALKKSEIPVKSKLKKDPGIPRLPNLKVKVQNACKKSKLATSACKDQDSPMTSEPSLSTLAMLAASSSNELDVGNSSSSPSLQKTKEQIKKHYIRALHKVVDESDIVILVLDARDPEGCRSRLVEEEVLRREAEGKKLVFVLNKIDLVPRSNAQSWLKYLRHSTPTLPFLSSASRQRTNISSSTSPALLRLLKGYKPMAGSITIGVVGYPNVGKSSLINSLKRSKVCAVAAQPGHTKNLQHIQLERGIKIIDSPGVVFDDDDFDDGKGIQKNNVLLRNVVKVEDVEDPISVVEEIYARTPRATLQRIYTLPEFSSTLEFLTMLAMTSGRLLKGGTPDLNSTARQILTDWNQQKIPYFSEPPTLHPSMIPSTIPSTRNDAAATIAPGGENVGQAQIVAEFSKPFELEGLFGAADAGAFAGRVDVDDQPMGMVDEEGDIFWDAVEDRESLPDEMDCVKDGVPMESDDLKHIIPRKRSRSPSEASTPMNCNSFTAESEAASRYTRPPKRQRRSKDVPSYDAPPDEHVQRQMGKHNPLNRRVLKREAKRARKALRVKTGGGAGLMDVDDDGLQFTFIA